MESFDRKFPVTLGLTTREVLCRRTSRVFMQWLRNPTNTRALGYDILREMKGWGVPVFLPEAKMCTE
jgi:hypothetical protein